jgi:hypothetical protein
MNASARSQDSASTAWRQPASRTRIAQLNPKISRFASQEPDRSRKTGVSHLETPDFRGQNSYELIFTQSMAKLVFLSGMLRGLLFYS